MYNKNYVKNNYYIKNDKNVSKIVLKSVKKQFFAGKRAVFAATA